MIKEKAQTLVTNQLYNLVAGFLYALSICCFAKGADFAPGGLSGLALLGNYLWGFPIGITTLVLNVPLVLFGFRFVGRAFLGKPSSVCCGVPFFRMLPLQTSPATAAIRCWRHCLLVSHGAAHWRFCICGHYKKQVMLQKRPSTDLSRSCTI